jgi:hypothetical protein
MFVCRNSFDNSDGPGATFPVRPGFAGDPEDEIAAESMGR